jgi:hypothetical protein
MKRRRDATLMQMNPFPCILKRVLGSVSTAAIPVLRCSMLNDHVKPPAFGLQYPLYSIHPERLQTDDKTK